MTGERWVVVPGTRDMNSRRTRHQVEGRTGKMKVIDVDTDEFLHPTIVFQVPDDFTSAWRRNRA